MSFATLMTLKIVKKKLIFCKFINKAEKCISLKGFISLSLNEKIFSQEKINNFLKNYDEIKNVYFIFC